tara:strand:- start:372 stop:563 length:192 start_codon:yes stop_codon:yes gene_type:complete
MDRYTLTSEKLDKHHPLNPEAEVWRVYDTVMKKDLFTYYLTEVVAQAACDKRNSLYNRLDFTK